MTIAKFNADVITEPAQYGIGFDRETWDFYIFVNGECVTALSADQSSALRDEILRTVPGKDG